MNKALSVTILCFAITGLLGCGHLKQARTYIEWDWPEDVSIKRILVVPLSFPGTLFIRDSNKIEQRFAEELPKYEYGDVRKKVNNESMRVRATFFTTLDGQVFLKPK